MRFILKNTIYKKVVYIFTFSISFYNYANAKEQLVTIELENWIAKINPTNLEVTAKNNNKSLNISAPIIDNLGEVKNLISTSENSSWSYPEKNISIEVTKNKNQVVFKFVSTKEQNFEWPSTLKISNSKNLIIPDGEGILIPVTSIFWLEIFKKYALNEYSMQENLTLPLFGVTTDNHTISYISNSSLNNTLKILNKNKKLYLLQTHQFRAIDKFDPYIISINFDNVTNPLAPAIHFRNNLIENKEFLSLKDKEEKNPNIKKLYGAMHAYVWGTGRTTQTLDLLSSLGIKNMWIGYDVGDKKTDKYQVDKNYIEKAKQLGYLVGPYDTWENMQNPKTADTPLSIFPNAWDKAAVIAKNGKKILGFHNRGYEASSEYFALQKPKNKDLYERAEKFKSTGVNSYFLDVDATGTLHDDYSKDHPMNISKDLQNRINRMQHLTDMGFVVGSETAVSWAIPHIAFAHGNNATFNAPHWPLARNVKVYGRWYPNERPEFFFKSIIAPKEYEETKFNPLYRIPLFQAAFHDSIVTTDRWEIPITKFKNLMQKRILIESLYGVPSNWALDIKEIKEYSSELKKLSSFFESYHKKIANLPLTKFTYITTDKLVQQTEFGDDVKVTANFSDKMYNGIPGKSVEVIYLKENKKNIFSP